MQLQVHSIHLQSTLPMPGLLMSVDPHITLISLQPRILLIENFLSAADCKVKLLVAAVILSWSVFHTLSGSMGLP